MTTLVLSRATTAQPIVAMYDDLFGAAVALADPSSFMCNTLLEGVTHVVLEVTGLCEDTIAHVQRQIQNAEIALTTAAEVVSQGTLLQVPCLGVALRKSIPTA